MEDEFEETATPCPSWCVSSHDDDAPGQRVHRGPLRLGVYNARQHGAGGGSLPSTGGAGGRFEVGLVEHEPDGTTWVLVRTPAGDQLEIDLRDMNRWVTQLGSAMVDVDQGRVGERRA